MGTQSLQLPDNREDAVLMLAKRAAVGRCTRMEKAAVGGDSLRRVFEWLKDNPAVGYSLAGAAGGAGMGGLLSMTRDEDERTPLASMATGALAGGGLGLGAGMLSGNPLVQEQLAKLPSFDDVKGKFSEGWQGFKDSFNPQDTPPPDAAAKNIPETAPELTPEQNESAAIQLGVRANLFTEDEFRAADLSGQNDFLGQVNDYATSNAMKGTEALGQAAWQNAPYAVGGAGAALGAKAYQAHRNMGLDFKEGLKTDAIKGSFKTLGNEQAQFGAALDQSVTPIQARQIGRAGHAWNPLTWEWVNKGKPTSAATMGLPPPLPGSGASLNPALGAVRVPQLPNSNVKGELGRSFAGDIRRTGKNSRIARLNAGKGLIRGRMPLGKSLGVLGAVGLGFKTMYDASQIHSQDYADQFTLGAGE